MKWIKEHTDSDFHPQVQLAGFWGGVVFGCLRRISGQHDLGGVIPPQHLHPEVIARRIQATDILPLAEAAKAVSEAIDRLCSPEVGLLVRQPDGSVLIDGWERVQGDTSAERVRRHRARQRAAAEGNADVTLQPVAETEGNAAKRGETLKRRVEEKRSEIPPLPPPAAGGQPEELELQPQAAGPPRPTPEQLVEAWNAATGGRITEVTGKRRKSALAALRRQPDLAWWRKCFQLAAAIRKTPGAGWCTFDWLLSEGKLGWNAERVAEGVFDFRLEAGRARPRPPASPPAPDPDLVEGARGHGLCPGCGKHTEYTVRNGSPVVAAHSCSSPAMRRIIGLRMEGDEDDAEEVAHAAG